MSQPPDELDEASVRRAFDRAAADYDRGADLQAEVADELLDRLAGVRVSPERIVDLGCGTGYAIDRLQRMYRRAEVIGVDFAPSMARRARTRRRPWCRPMAVCADARRTPLADHSADVVFSNLTLQWIGDLAAFFGEVRRLLRPGGVLMFSTFGPDTLSELRAAWARVDSGVHINTFLDMHDIGDAVLAAGLTEPVMDVDRWHRRYADLRTLMRAIKAIGAHNAARGRPRGLTGRERMRQLESAYTETELDGGVVATWEIAYGHAWGAPTPRAAPGGAGEFHVPVESIGRRRANNGD